VLVLTRSAAKDIGKFVVLGPNMLFKPAHRLDLPFDPAIV